MSGTILRSNPPTLMHPDKAEELAATLNAGAGDDWEYKAIHDPESTGLSYVEIRGNGRKIGTL